MVARLTIQGNGRVGGEITMNEIIFETESSSDCSVYSYCHHCDTTLTQEEKDWYFENVPTCCSGVGCGCMGAPLEPPYCFKCMNV